MARTWFSLTVELLGGRGEELWPYPGRVFAVAPSHTFADLADAINAGFARWDLSHLSVFTLADGRVITDEETGAEFAASMGGPLSLPLDFATTKVGGMLELGAELQFVFDLGDGWTHRCTVGDDKIDPLEELGIRPNVPLPYWGWGAIPDQYGRRWSDDGGEGRLPKRPSSPHPMLLGAWPGEAERPELDVTAVRVAIGGKDAAGLLAAIAGRDIDTALQQIGEGMSMLLAQGVDGAEELVLSVINRLRFRADEGDRELSDDLLALLRGEEPEGRMLPVDLEMLSMLVEGDPDFAGGAYVDLNSGEVYPDSATDEGMVGEDGVIDVESDPDRWLWLSAIGSRDGWQDMATFASRCRDTGLRQRLERAIEGSGAFRRFRDLVGDEDLLDEWRIFSTDRQLGRARALLAAEGIRVGDASGR